MRLPEAWAKIVAGVSAEQARKNAKRIEREVDSLSSGHWSMFERQYKEFWAHAKSVSSLFKSLKPLDREDRERLWAKFQRVCESTKAKQNREYDKKRSRSEELRSWLLKEAESARPHTLFGFDPPNIDDMKALGRVLKNTGALLSKHKKEMWGEHKQEVFERIQEIREVHDAWWKDLKATRSRRHADFQQRVRGNLEKNHERHRKASDALARARGHAEDLRSKISTAWNDDFRDRAHGWLSETENRIRDIEESILRIEGWIREDEEKLR